MYPPIDEDLRNRIDQISSEDAIWDYPNIFEHAAIAVVAYCIFRECITATDNNQLDLFIKTFFSDGQLGKRNVLHFAEKAGLYLHAHSKNHAGTILSRGSALAFRIAQLSTLKMNPKLFDTAPRETYEIFGKDREEQLSTISKTCLNAIKFINIYHDAEADFTNPLLLVSCYIYSHIWFSISVLKHYVLQPASKRSSLRGDDERALIAYYQSIINSDRNYPLIT